MSVPQTYQELQMENEQLKTKYKKSLQQLMTVLQINKVLKESASQNNSSLEASKKEDSQQLRKAKEESTVLRSEMEKSKNEEERKVKQLLAKNHSLEEENHRMKGELERERRKSNEVGQSMSRMRSSLNSAHQNYEYELSHLKSQNMKLMKELQSRKNDERQTERLENQLYTLKDTLVSIDQQRQEEKAKWRRQKNELEQYYISLRREDDEKFGNLQFKYSLLEAQLKHERGIEQFLRSEERQMKAEEELFESVRVQIQKINQDWRKIEQQKNGELETMSAELASKQKMIADLQAEKDRNQEEIRRLKQQVTGFQTELQQKGKLQQKISLNESEKRQLLEKNNVLEALTMTQRHRHGIEVSERIQEFERRVHLLLEEKGKNLEGMAGIQQIIILKSYIRQLSELVNNYKHRQQKLVRSKSVLKTRQKSMQKEFKGQMQAYNKKMKDYDIFFKKLYSMLQSKLKEKHHSNVPPEHEVINTIHKYQELTIQMSEEIRNLKNELELMENKSKANTQLRDNCEVSMKVEKQELQFLQEENKKLQFHYEGLQIQNNNLLAENDQLHASLNEAKEEAVEIVKQKDQIISGLTMKNQKLEKDIFKKNQQKKQLKQLLDGYSKENQDLHAEIAVQSKKKVSFESNQEAPQELLERIGDLEEQVSILTKDKEELNRQSIQIQKDKEKEYEVKFWEQNQEIASCRAQIQRLESQAERSRNNEEINENQQIMEELREEIFNLTTYKEDMQKKISRLTTLIEESKDKNQQLQIQLTHKERELQLCYEDLKKRNQQTTDVFTSTKKIEIESEEINMKSLRESRQKDKEIQNLNSLLLNLRTEKLGLESDIKQKQSLIGELKQDIYDVKLQQQKQRSSENLIDHDQIQKIKAMNNELTQQIESLVKEKQELLKKNNEISQQLECLMVTQNKELQKQNYEIEVKFQSLITENQELKKIINQLEEEKGKRKTEEEREEKINEAIQNNTSLDFTLKRSNSPPKSPLLKNHPSSPHPDYNIPEEFQKIEIIPQAHLNEDKCKVVESYDVIPVNDPPVVKAGAKSTIYQKEPKHQEQVNPTFAADFGRKKEETKMNGGMKRSIKAIKFSVKSNGEIDSPLISNKREE